ncbi:MAG: ATP-binding protein, partial [Chloroflexota bacterium]
MIESLLKIIINADYNNLDPLRKEIEKVGEMFSIPESVVYNFLLAVTEIVTNIIEHGYQEMGGEIEVEIAREKNDLLIYIRDNAPYFDPTTIKKPDLSLPLEERPVGGVGFYLV